MVPHLNNSDLLQLPPILNGSQFSFFVAPKMKPATIARIAGPNRLKSCLLNRTTCRYLTLLHPPKFENEKPVSLQNSLAKPEASNNYV